MGLNYEDMKYFVGGILDYNKFEYNKDFNKRSGVQFLAIFITILIAAVSGLVAGFSISGFLSSI